MSVKVISRKPSRFYKKYLRKRTVDQKQSAQIKRLSKILKPEKKYQVYTIAAAAAAVVTGTMYRLNGLASTDPPTFVSRIGRTVQQSHYNMNFIITSTAATQSIARLVMIRWSDDTSPVPGNILIDATGTISVDSNYNPLYKSKFQVVRDMRFAFGRDQAILDAARTYSTAVIPKCGSIADTKQYQVAYTDDTATSGIKGVLWLLFIANSTSIALTADGKVLFTDM